MDCVTDARYSARLHFRELAVTRRLGLRHLKPCQRVPIRRPLINATPRLVSSTLADKSRQAQHLRYRHRLSRHHIIKALTAALDSSGKHRTMPDSAAHPDRWNSYPGVAAIRTHPTIQIPSSIQPVRINRLHRICRRHRSRFPIDRSKRAAVRVPAGRKYAFDVRLVTYHGSCASKIRCQLTHRMRCRCRI